MNRRRFFLSLSCFIALAGTFLVTAGVWPFSANFVESPFRTNAQQCTGGGDDEGGGGDCQMQSCCGPIGAECCVFDYTICSCNCSPILIDVQGDGFRLTSASGGVNFDLNADGQAGRIAWTAATDDAWLVLDRNGNGSIDSGRELFGNFTPQTPAPKPNGFLALSEYDKSENGGNGDGAIDQKDAVFSRLQLWQDLNHDGISGQSELHSLPELNVVRLLFNFREARWRDEYGNWFRYRAKVYREKGEGHVRQWAWDVYLVR